MPRGAKLVDHSDQWDSRSLLSDVQRDVRLGTVGNQKFDVKQLSEMKKGCEPNCFSTLGYNVAYCYSTTRVMRWLWKQAMNGFQGATGSFE